MTTRDEGMNTLRYIKSRLRVRKKNNPALFLFRFEFFWSSMIFVLKFFISAISIGSFYFSILCCFRSSQIFFAFSSLIFCMQKLKSFLFCHWYLLDRYSSLIYNLSNIHSRHGAVLFYNWKRNNLSMNKRDWVGLKLITSVVDRGMKTQD